MRGELIFAKTSSKVPPPRQQFKCKCIEIHFNFNTGPSKDQKVWSKLRAEYFDIMYQKVTSVVEESCLPHINVHTFDKFMWQTNSCQDMQGLLISIISYFLLFSISFVCISYFLFQFWAGWSSPWEGHAVWALVAETAKWGNQAISQSNQSDQHGIEQHQL